LLPKAVIAQVAGLASAAGCQLAASCDLVVAASTAQFQTPGVKIGLFCSTPMIPLSRAVSPKKAMEMLLTGQAISAEAAEKAGLVTRIVPPESLATETMALAKQIAAYSGDTLGLGKAAFYAQLPLGLPQAYAVGKDAMQRNAAMADAQEGMSAFLQKREPKWNS
ncbi:MAG TPA: enoyl-CoA hydratase-related protein, partial [bacterium]